MNSWMIAGLVLMLSGLGLLLSMVVGTTGTGLGLSLVSYGLLFAGVFCYTAGVLRRRH